MEDAIRAKADAIPRDGHVPRISAAEIFRESAFDPFLDLRPQGLADVEVFARYPQRHIVLHCY